MKKLLPVAIAGMLLAGCASSKFSSYAETGTTKNADIQANASNWLLVAKDVADKIKLNTDKIGAPVFVTLPANSSKFGRAFYEQVVTSLVNQGVTVRKFNDGTAQIVDIDTQLVRFVPEKQANRRIFGLTLGSGNEVHANYEVIITTSLVKNSQFVARRTDAYPVNEYDASLYNKDTDFKFKVIGGQL